MEVGSLEIVGKIDVSSIKSGLAQLGQGLDVAKAKAKDTFGDMEKLSGTLGNIGSHLLTIGTGLAGTLVGLAALGPATAPALARMQVSFFEMTRVLGEALQPAFETFADLFEGFVGWLNSDQGIGVMSTLNTVLLGVGEGLKDVGAFAKTALDSMSGLSKNFELTFGVKLDGFAQWVAEHFGFPALAGIIGFKVGGPIGGVIGAGAAITGQEYGNFLQGQESLVPPVFDNVKSLVYGVQSGNVQESIGAFGDVLLNTLSVGLYGYGKKFSNVWTNGYNSESEYEREMNDFYGLTNRQTGGN